MLGHRRGGERASALGQVEDVAVPVQNRRLGRQRAEHRVVAVLHLDRREADLRPLPRPHLGAQGPREELGAEAGAEHRYLPVDRPRQPLALGLQLRMAAKVVDVHRAAHRHHAVDLLVGGQRVAGQRFDLAQLDAGAEGVADPVGALPGRVYEDEHGGQERAG